MFYQKRASQCQLKMEIGCLMWINSLMKVFHLSFSIKFEFIFHFLIVLCCEIINLGVVYVNFRGFARISINIYMGALREHRIHIKQTVKFSHFY